MQQETSNKAIVTNVRLSLVSRAAVEHLGQFLAYPRWVLCRYYLLCTTINTRCNTSSLTRTLFSVPEDTRGRGEKTKKKDPHGRVVPRAKAQKPSQLETGSQPGDRQAYGAEFQPSPAWQSPHTKSPGSESGPMAKLLEKAPPPNREVGYSYAS